MPPRVPRDARVQIVVLAQEGLSRHEILRRVRRPVKTMQSIIAEFRDDDGRLDDVPPPHRRRPRATTAREDRRILEATLDDPFLAARDIRDALEPEISDTAVRRRLYDASLHSHVACQSPLLTERHKQLRLDFTHSLENSSVEDWTHVIFSDESTFCTRLDQQRRVRRPENFRQALSALGDIILYRFILPPGTSKAISDQDFLRNHQWSAISLPSTPKA
ncbi:hypothetical protein HPB47_003596 [Ixodes persulcatus]|uniref:Uncharacterized protein n=1 Tax=Ixodes persulcatus TaxID=34615 RepID=A0AC60PHZ0_IXOPE|nr:hypothetical protein HPB47_003596 [Ixodes persulcatus]